MKFLVAQLGARMHYAVPRLFARAGQLDHFYTDIAATKGLLRALARVPARLRPAGLERLLGRSPGEIAPSDITHFPSFGVRYLLRLASSPTQTAKTETHLWAGQTFCDRIVRRGLGRATGVYVFNSAGLELLKHARERGLLTVMEQTIAPLSTEHSLLRTEAEKFPDWTTAPAEAVGFEKAVARERAEWELADVIVCGSEFVRESIKSCGGPAHKVVVVAYGIDSTFIKEEKNHQERPLRVLTVGTVGLRKGIPYVVEAAKRLRPRVEFRAVGPIEVPAKALDLARNYVEFPGAVPRSQVSEHFRWADVFLLPSVCEGSATASYEAMAHGLPVITTPNAGSVVRDNVDGFVVPPGDAEPIIEKLELLLQRPEVRREMSYHAVNRAREHTVPKYAQRLLAALHAQTPLSRRFAAPAF